jgi:hypothetical protein
MARVPLRGVVARVIRRVKYARRRECARQIQMMEWNPASDGECPFTPLNAG